MCNPAPSPWGPAEDDASILDCHGSGKITSSQKTTHFATLKVISIHRHSSAVLMGWPKGWSYVFSSGNGGSACMQGKYWSLWRLCRFFWAGARVRQLEPGERWKRRDQDGL